MNGRKLGIAGDGNLIRAEHLFPRPGSRLPPPIVPIVPVVADWELELVHNQATVYLAELRSTCPELYAFGVDNCERQPLLSEYAPFWEYLLYLSRAPDGCFADYKEHAWRKCTVKVQKLAQLHFLNRDLYGYEAKELRMRAEALSLSIQRLKAAVQSSSEQTGMLGALSLMQLAVTDVLAFAHVKRVKSERHLSSPRTYDDAG